MKGKVAVTEVQWGGCKDVSLMVRKLCGGWRLHDPRGSALSRSGSPKLSPRWFRQSVTDKTFGTLPALLGVRSGYVCGTGFAPEKQGLLSTPHLSPPVRIATDARSTTQVLITRCNGN